MPAIIPCVIEADPVINDPKGVDSVKTWVKVLIVTVLVAAPAFLLGPVLFPPAEGGPTPTAGQMPFFLFLALTDAVLLGLGGSFLLFGFPVMRRVSPTRRRGRGRCTSRSAT